MPDRDRALAIGVGVAQGLEKAVTNIYNIGQAKAKLEREKQTFDLDIKVKKAQLKKAEFLVGPERLKAETERFNLETKTKKAAFTLNSMKVEQARAEQVGILENIKTEARIKAEAYREFEETGELASGVAFDFDGLEIKAPEERTKEERYEEDIITRYQKDPESVTPEELKKVGMYVKPEDEKDLTATKRKVLGEVRGLKAGGAPLEEIQTVIRFRGYEPEDFTEELEGYVTEEGSWPWSKKRGVERRGAAEGKIVLPPHLKKTSEAVDFLKRYHNMNDEQALDWLRKQ